jgi:protein TonB
MSAALKLLVGLLTSGFLIVSILLVRNGGNWTFIIGNFDSDIKVEQTNLNPQQSDTINVQTPQPSSNTLPQIPPPVQPQVLPQAANAEANIKVEVQQQSSQPKANQEEESKQGALIQSPPDNITHQRDSESNLEDSGASPSNTSNGTEKYKPVENQPGHQQLRSFIRRSEGVIQGQAIRRITPEYPRMAKDARIQGDVTLEVTISEEGRVISARCISGNNLLQKAAIDAAMQWRFSPTLLSNQAVTVIGTLTFRFRL